MVPRAVSFGSNLERFSDSATVAGHFNPLVETDGVIRRVPLFVDYEDDLYETLSLAMLRLSVGLDQDPDAIELPVLSAIDVAEGVAYRLGDSDIRLPGWIWRVRCLFRSGAGRVPLSTSRSLTW